jgi:hypothetical protein
MLDQSFSNTNFLKIFHIQNRKGTFQRAFYPKEYFQKHEECKQIIGTIKEKRLLLNKQELIDLNEQVKEINKAKEEILLNLLAKISDIVNEKSFRFSLDVIKRNEKNVYTTNKDAASFFAIKQLQYNIFRTFRVKQANRHDIVSQLYRLLSDDFHKIIIRTDIKGFYESIPQDKLFKKIEENQLLNYQSKKLIRNLIFRYEEMKDGNEYTPGRGVPRGIGVSAYLSELYMRDIDNEIKSMDDLVYYARYVDDIVLIFTPPSKNSIPDYLDKIVNVITKYDLSLKDGSDGEENKTKEIRLLDTAIDDSLTYLGYEFIIKNSKIRELRLSHNKIKKYKDRLTRSIEEYNICSKYNEREARKMLIARLKFLTGNFHLKNFKRQIKAGVFYSNVLLSLNKIDDRKKILEQLNGLLKGSVSKIS